MTNDENRTRALQFVGNGWILARMLKPFFILNFKPEDQTYSQGGLALSEEAELDLHGEQFAWDAELLSIELDDLNLSDPVIAVITLTEKSKSGSSVSFSYSNRNYEFQLSAEDKDKNGSISFVKLAGNPAGTVEALQIAIEKEDIGVTTKIDGASLSIFPKRENLPTSKPSFSSTGEGVKISGTIDDNLIAYHSNKEESIFEEPARTFATALTFESDNYLQIPPAPDEARMLSYFERNKDEFAPPTPPTLDVNQTEGEGRGAKGPVGQQEANTSESNASASDSLELDLLSALENDANKSKTPEVTFEQVKDEVRQRIIDGDRIDAERYAETAARDAALAFLDEINSQDKLRNKYKNYGERRSSPELAELIAKHKAQPKTISFTQKDMFNRGMALGLVTRESERKASRQPLEEVENLNERAFFTRSVRKARDGYVVFVLDSKTEAGPGEYAQATFRDLYNGYADKLKTDAFLKIADKELEKMSDSKLQPSTLELGKNNAKVPLR